MNSSDYAYGVFLIDDKSLDAYEQNLSKINDQVNKVVLVNELIVMMKELKYPATRLPRILNQLYDEPNQNLINGAFTALYSARTAFLPQDKVKDFNKEVANFFLKKAVKEQESQGLQQFCLEKAITFGIDKESLTLFANWIF